MTKRPATVYVTIRTTETIEVPVDELAKEVGGRAYTRAFQADYAVGHRSAHGYHTEILSFDDEVLADEPKKIRIRKGVGSY